MPSVVKATLGRMIKDDKTGDLLAFLDNDLREEYDRYRAPGAGHDFMRTHIVEKQQVRNRKPSAANRALSHSRVAMILPKFCR